MSHDTPVLNRKKTGAHFTPPALGRFVARQIVDVMQFEGRDRIDVLDPACGDGVLLQSLAEVLPEQFYERTTLTGVDENAVSVEQARERLAACSCDQVELKQADFLELCGEQASAPDLFAKPSALKPVHAVIANPPYVRTQVLGASKARRLASAFGLEGRLDLYQAFLVGMTQMLCPGGVLGVIASNRFLSTKAGGATRRFLSREYDIRAVYDLGDTKLFEKAAVLPAIFVGVKRPLPKERGNGKARFLKIYERRKSNADQSAVPEEAVSVYDLLNDERDGRFSVGRRTFSVTSGTLSILPSPSAPWELTTDEEANWLETIKANAACRFGDLVDVRVGIKTNADEVFVKEDWTALPQAVQPEAGLLRDLLTSTQAARWKPQQERLPLVLYPHEVRQGQRKAVSLQDYPKAAAYFERHRERLEKRTYLIESGRRWFEVWVPQNPSAWSKPKIVFPDISAEPKFFYDEQGRVVKGNCYWFTADAGQDPDLLFLLQGIANTRLATRFHDLSFNNKLYAGRRRYLTQYVKKYPVPDPASDLAERISTLAKKLVFGTGDETERGSTEEKLEETVAQAFGVSPLN